MSIQCWDCTLRGGLRMLHGPQLLERCKRCSWHAFHDQGNLLQADNRHLLLSECQGYSVLRGVPVAIACNPSPIPVLPSLKPSISISPQPSLVATSRHTHSNTTTQHSLHALPSRTIRPLEGHWPTCSHKPVKRACIMLRANMLACASRASAANPSCAIARAVTLRLLPGLPLFPAVAALRLYTIAC